MAIWPDVKMNPLALTACEYGPMAWGASLVEMISRIKEQLPVASCELPVKEYKSETGEVNSKDQLATDIRLPEIVFRFFAASALHARRESSSVRP
jgi:hypothetical protein